MVARIARQQQPGKERVKHESTDELSGSGIQSAQPAPAQAENQPYDEPAAQRPGVRFTSSIRTRLLALALGLTLVALVVIALVAFDSASNVIRQAQQTSSESLRAQAEVYLQQINASIAGQNNLILDRAARDVQAVADTTAAIFNGESSNQPLTSLGQAKNLVTGPQGQYPEQERGCFEHFYPEYGWESTNRPGFAARCGSQRIS